MTIRLNTLPLDIIHRLLVLLPDYLSLRNLILSTRVIYVAYTDHSKLISEAIARNLAGPAFIHAWNANRPGDEVLDPSVVFPLSALEQSNFDKECHASWALEDLYSLKYKDATSKTSCLTSAESFRFQRALHRITHLWYELYNCAGSKVDAPEIAAKFCQLTVNELREVGDVCRFLYQLLYCIVIFEDDVFPCNHVCSTIFPRVILEAFIAGPDPEGTEIPGLAAVKAHWDPSRGYSFHFYIWRAVYQAKGVEDRIFERDIGYAIIKESDTPRRCCHRCGQGVTGQETIWCLNNLHLFRAQIKLIKLSTYLLEEQEQYKQRLYEALLERIRREGLNTAWLGFMEELYDVCSPNAGWDKQQQYCKRCIHQLFTDSIPLWWEEELKKNANLCAPQNS